MALNIDQRLANLRTRRLGSQDLMKSLGLAEKAERYQERSRLTGTRYALGAMQEVDLVYTENSVKEGDRVKNQLTTGLQSASIEANYRYQGSVPLNVHIRGISDIDLLVLHGRYITYDRTGVRAVQGRYTPLNISLPHEVADVRAHCVSILRGAFPEATVDNGGAKSIAIFGGSLRRKIDVVPAYWNDCTNYQATMNEVLREVVVVDKTDGSVTTNLPFLYMSKINEKDAATSGGTKKVIRLIKTLRSDSDEEITLSSYDIGSLVWHFDGTQLAKPWNREIGLVSYTLDVLNWVAANQIEAAKLRTPDDTRIILDDPGKVRSIQKLAMDLRELATEIANEFAPIVPTAPMPQADRVRRVLTEAQV